MFCKSLKVKKKIKRATRGKGGFDSKLFLAFAQATSAWVAINQCSRYRGRLRNGVLGALANMAALRACAA